MWAIAYLLAVLAVVIGVQNLVRLSFRVPLAWSLTWISGQPRALKYSLKAVLHAGIIGSLLLFPHLHGRDLASYYAPLFPAEQRHLYTVGLVFSILGLCLIYALGMGGGWTFYKARWSPQERLRKSALSALSSLTVSVFEEAFFRAVLLQYLLFAAPPGSAAAPGSLPPLVAIPLSAAVFSAAHFIKRVPTYWPAVGLALLGLWLGVAYYKTGSLWLSIGLHAGGILSIGVHRCFIEYREKQSGKYQWLVGTQTYPIAGIIAMTVMVGGAVATWFLF